MSNIPKTVTEDDIRQYFEKFGQIEEVKVTRTRKLSFGFVKFMTMDAVEKAFESGTKVTGQEDAMLVSIKNHTIECEREMAEEEEEEVCKISRFRFLTNFTNNMYLWASQTKIFCVCLFVCFCGQNLVKPAICLNNVEYFLANFICEDLCFYLHLSPEKQMNMQMPLSPADLSWKNVSAC